MPATTAALLFGLAIVSSPQVAAGETANDRDGVSFNGRVIEKDVGTPVAAATLVLSRTVAGMIGKDATACVGETTIHADALGQFTVAFPPEQVAAHGLAFAISRVAHRDFVPRQSRSVPLANLLQGRKFGDKPFFETIELERGLEFHGEFVTPEDRPAAEIPYQFSYRSRSSPSEWFFDRVDGRTDAQGRFHACMPKSVWDLTISATPTAYASFHHDFGPGQPGGEPHGTAPIDLGRFVLDRGESLSGRLLDVNAKPIAGQELIALATHQYWAVRKARTDADGAFSFGCLRAANYMVFAAGQDDLTYAQPDLAPLRDTRSNAVIMPAQVYFRANQRPEPIVLHEIPSVTVEVSFVDARGRPAAGSPVTLSGTIVNEAFRAAEVPLVNVKRVPAMNAPEADERNNRLSWSSKHLPDAQGRVIFRVPKGLRDASFSASPPDETIAYKTRLERNGAIKLWSDEALGTLAADREGVTILSYKAPVVLATVRSEDGGNLFDEPVVDASFNRHGSDFGSGVTRQADGRYRSVSLMPDHEYEFSAWARGYVPNTVQRVNLREGETAELTLILRKKPIPPALGEPAPPFVVKTIDGQVVSLQGLRGKYVLLHFSMPIFLEEIPHLKAIHKRFGQDDRFAMLTLWLVNDPADATKVITDQGLSWPQAVLRDRGADPITMEYGGWFPPKTFLIGPDGKLLAKELQGAKIAEAVAMALTGTK